MYSIRYLCLLPLLILGVMSAAATTEGRQLTPSSHGSPKLSTAEDPKPIGCVVMIVPNQTYGVTDPNNMQEVCQNGICRWYDISDCGNCRVEVCYGATYHVCEDAGCSVIYEGTPVPPGLFINCNVGRHVALRCRGVGNPRAYKCRMNNCLNCSDSTIQNWIGPYIAAWQAGGWVTVGGKDFTCECDKTPPCCT
jgi:hypothetical protein